MWSLERLSAADPTVEAIPVSESNGSQRLSGEPNKIGADENAEQESKSE